MKLNKIIPFLLILILSNLSATNLISQQQNKLISSVVKIQNDIFTIEEYNSINFTKKVFFDGKNTDKIIVKTEATMKKGIIHKEQFIAISSTLSDQIAQSIFMNPQYLSDIQSVELLTMKPNKVDLTIKISFTKDGLNTIITNGQREQKRFVSYSEIFKQRLQ